MPPEYLSSRDVHACRSDLTHGRVGVGEAAPRGSLTAPRSLQAQSRPLPHVDALQTEAELRHAGGLNPRLGHLGFLLLLLSLESHVNLEDFYNLPLSFFAEAGGAASLSGFNQAVTVAQAFRSASPPGPRAACPRVLALPAPPWPSSLVFLLTVPCWGRTPVGPFWTSGSQKHLSWKLENAHLLTPPHPRHISRSGFSHSHDCGPCSCCTWLTDGREPRGCCLGHGEGVSVCRSSFSPLVSHL